MEKCQLTRQAKRQLKNQQAEAMNRLLSSLSSLACSANDAETILGNAELAHTLLNHVAEIKDYLGVAD